MEEVMFYHVIETRTGLPVPAFHKHVKTYKNFKRLTNFLERNQRPCWVVYSNYEYIQLDKHGFYGGFNTYYWNSGGWGEGEIPRLEVK
jgi:hypothetical protein